MATYTVNEDQTFAFGPFQLDVHRGVLSKGETQVFLRPKAFSLIHHLAQNLGRVVPKAELMDAVWPGVYVTEDSLTQSIREIRKAIGDNEQQVVRTISRRGYMLIGEAASAAERENATQQPVVAVLRFRNDGEAGDQSLVDGFASDIINGLAGFGSVAVLAGHSSFQFESFRASAPIGERIGADFLVEGSIRRSDTTAITVNLVNARSSAHIWGDRYETEDVASLEVQREIASKIVNRVLNRIHEQSLRRDAMTAPRNLAAYHLVVEGAAGLLAYPVVPASAQEPFERAIEKDPGYAPAYAGLAWARMMIGGFSSATPAVLADAEALARKAIALSADQSRAYQVLALAELFQRRFQEAEADLRHSLELNRFDAYAVEHMGNLLTLRGRPLEALAWIDRAIKLNPIHPRWYEYDRSLALYLIGEYQAAADAIVDQPELAPWVRTRLAGTLAQLDDVEGAKRQILRVRTDHPDFSPASYAQSGIAFEHNSDRDHLAEGIRLAMAAASLQ